MQIFSSELSYQSLNGILPSRKCSTKALDKWKTSIYVLKEIRLQWSKWFGPWCEEESSECQKLNRIEYNRASSSYSLKSILNRNPHMIMIYHSFINTMKKIDECILPHITFWWNVLSGKEFSGFQKYKILTQWMEQKKIIVYIMEVRSIVA